MKLQDELAGGPGVPENKRKRRGRIRTAPWHLVGARADNYTIAAILRDLSIHLKDEVRCPAARNKLARKGLVQQ